MSEYIHKSHNVTVLLYHFVCPSKYRRVVFDEDVEKVLKDVCEGIELRYEIRFLEVGTDKDHVHFLVQSVPKLSATQIITIIKSITAKEIFTRCPQVKKKLWGGHFWTDGYFVNTVGQHGNEATISEYVKNQGKQVESLLEQREAFTSELAACRKEIQSVEEKYKQMGEYGQGFQFLGLVIPMLLAIIFAWGNGFLAMVLSVAIGVVLGFAIFAGIGFCIQRLVFC